MGFFKTSCTEPKAAPSVEQPQQKEEAPSSSSSTHYETLGVAPKASYKEIRKAYLQLSLKYHPDKNPVSKQSESQQEFIKIGKAHEILSSPTKRAKYDRELKREKKQNGSSKSPKRGRGTKHSFPTTTKTRSSSKQQQKEQEDTFETYREAFDSTVAGMSEEELKAAVGVAVAVVGIVGSLLGAACVANNNAKKNNNGNKSRNAGALAAAGTSTSIVSSLVASEAASKFLKVLHQSSKERAAMDTERREKGVARSSGGSNNNNNSPATRHWNDMMTKFGTLATEAAVASVFASSAKNDKERSQLKDALGQVTAFGLAAKAAMDNYDKEQKGRR